MTNKKYNPFVDTYNFNANSSNWVQRLGHNADFYNNPLGYNSSVLASRLTEKFSQRRPVEIFL